MQILGIKIDNLTKKEALIRIQNVFNNHGRLFITTPNPEMTVLAQSDQVFKEILNSADLALPDGFGLKIAARFQNKVIKERITGTDFILELASFANQNNLQLFLLGAQGGAGESTKIILKNKFPELEIITDEEKFTNHPHKKIILLVALGHGRQEKIAKALFDQYQNIFIAMGVGGAFDFLSGRVPRAPRFLRQVGLEWLFRLTIEPWRARRIWKAIPVFLYYVLKNKLTKFL